MDAEREHDPSEEGMARDVVGHISNRRMQVFLFSLPLYLRALRLGLLTPAPRLGSGPTAPQQRKKHTAVRNVTDEELFQIHGSARLQLSWGRGTRVLYRQQDHDRAEVQRCAD